MTEQTLLRLAEKEQEKLNQAARNSCESFLAYGALLALSQVAFESRMYQLNDTIHGMLYAHQAAA